MTRCQEYQITACVAELRNGATTQELLAKGYAAAAVEKAQERLR